MVLCSALLYLLLVPKKKKNQKNWRASMAQQNKICWVQHLIIFIGDIKEYIIFQYGLFTLLLILECPNSTFFCFLLMHVLFVFLFWTNKRYNNALHKTIKLCFYLSVVEFYFIFSLASRFVVISSYFCSLNGSLIWWQASLLNIQQNKKKKKNLRFL